jgi:hypothetical protein
VATVAAFFVTQHLKVTTPLIAGTPAPVPAWINPVSGVTCYDPGHQKLLDHRATTVSFYLLHRADDVTVYIVDQAGNTVATLASNRPMRPKERVAFTWNGRVASGVIAPDGVYYLRVTLGQQARTFNITTDSGQSEPITVRTAAPRPVLTSVTPSVAPSGSNITIRYAGNENRGGTVVIYRADVPGGPRQVKTFPTQWSGHTVIWNGRIDERPAPPGVYLIGLQVTDAACNTGSSSLHEVRVS